MRQNELLCMLHAGYRTDENIIKNQCNQSKEMVEFLCV